MYYKGGRGVVPPAGVCPGKMIVKFRGWPRDMDMCRCFPPDPSLGLGRDGVRNVCIDFTLSLYRPPRLDSRINKKTC